MVATHRGGIGVTFQGSHIHPHALRKRHTKEKRRSMKLRRQTFSI
jgi:hypothetical protein